MSGDESVREIQRRMQDVRRDLGQEVEELVASAREITDWRRYVRAYPWACLGAAAAVGFIVAPRSAGRVRLSSSDLDRLAHHTHPEPVTPSSVTRRVSQTIVRTVGMAAMRALMAYVGQRIGEVGSTLSGQEKTPLFR
ncbi:MAG: hypothetical protein AB7F89_22545 [Pirellulaceae bacterium]